MNTMNQAAPLALGGEALDLFLRETEALIEQEQEAQVPAHLLQATLASHLGSRSYRVDNLDQLNGLFHLWLYTNEVDAALHLIDTQEPHVLAAMNADEREDSLVEFAADGSDDHLTYGFQGSGNQYVTAQVRPITGQYVRLESAGAAVLVEGGLDAHFGDIVDSAGRRLSWEQLMAQALGNQGAPVHATGTHRWYGSGGDDELASDTAGYHFVGGKQYDDELHGGDGDEPFINGANDPEWRQTA